MHNNSGVHSKLLIICVPSDEGINWRNINKPATIDDNITMVDVIMMMLVDAVICLLITWYVEAVHPGDEGVPQPFYFPFTVKVSLQIPSRHFLVINAFIDFLLVPQESLSR